MGDTTVHVLQRNLDYKDMQLYQREYNEIRTYSIRALHQIMLCMMFEIEYVCIQIALMAIDVFLDTFRTE